MDLMTVRVPKTPPPTTINVRGGSSNSRQISMREGKLKRREMLRLFRKWNLKIESDVSNIEDFNLLSSVAFILDCIADLEDVCGEFGCVESEEGGVFQLFIDKIRVDQEIQTALFARYGRDVVEDAHLWIRTWIKSKQPPITWIGWRFGHMVVDNDPNESKSYRIEYNHVILDMKASINTLGITLLDRENLFESTLLPFPTWQEDAARSR